jgi:bifunctional non-homologous end joining protein LigD
MSTFKTPKFISPMLCKSVTELPRREDWLFEIKSDACRAIAVKDGEDVSLFSRNGTPLNYPEVRKAIRTLPARSAVLDGDIVALDSNGRPCPESLAKPNTPSPLHFYAFDILQVNRRCLLIWPLENRKSLLGEIVSSSAVRFLPGLDCEPKTLVARARRQGFNDVVAKRRHSPYRAGQRNGDWLKLRVRCGP